MKREQCEQHIEEIQSFLGKYGVDHRLMQFQFLERTNRVYFIVFADTTFSQAGFVSCNQDFWKMQDVISSQLKMGRSVYVYDAPASSSQEGFNITPGLLDQHYFRIFHVIMHEILNTHLKSLSYSLEKTHPEYRKVDAIKEGLTDWLVSSLLIIFFDEKDSKLTNDLRTYINLALLSNFALMDSLYRAMRDSKEEAILPLQQKLIRNKLFFNAIYPGQIKQSRYGTTTSGPRDISSAYVFLWSRYATSFMAVERAAQKHQLVVGQVIRNPAQYKDLFLAELQ